MNSYKRSSSLIRAAIKCKFLIGLGILALVSIIGLSAFAAGVSDDETAIRASVMGFQEAWNHHDMKAMGSLFTEDADLINVGGMHWCGRTNIVKALMVFHRAMFAKSEIHLHDITIRFITPDVAVAVSKETGSGVMTEPDGHQETSTGGSIVNTFVVVKRDGVWKLTHCHNTKVDPNGTQFDPVNSGWNGEIRK
jgi:uncharacterized protein (TIGR02246 family)